MISILDFIINKLVYLRLGLLKLKKERLGYSQGGAIPVTKQSIPIPNNILPPKVKINDERVHTSVKIVDPIKYVIDEYWDFETQRFYVDRVVCRCLGVLNMPSEGCLLLLLELMKNTTNIIEDDNYCQHYNLINVRLCLGAYAY